MNCLFTIIRRHNHLGDAFTLEKKLAIWNRLVNFLQCLLNHQPSISGQGQSKTHPVVDTSQAKELYQFRDKEMDRSADQEMDVHVSMEETSGCSQHFDTNDSSTTEEHKTSFLDVINFLEEKAEKSPCSAGSGLSLKSSVKIPNLAWHNPNASDRNSEFVLSVSSINAMYKTLVYEDNWERQGSKVILVQVQSVIAAIVMSFDIEDFTKVIQGIVEDVVGMTVLTRFSCRGSNSFIFASHLIRGQLLKERICFPRSKFFPVRVDLILKGLHCPGKGTGSHRSCFPCKNDYDRLMLFFFAHTYHKGSLSLVKCLQSGFEPMCPA